MTRILILGAGGHGQVVADILARSAGAGTPDRVIGYLDDNPHMHDKWLLNVQVLGHLSDIDVISHDELVLAIGDNRRRQQLFAQLSARGESFAIARHPAAVIAPDVRIGPGTVICAGVIINPGSVIGSNVILNTGCSIDHHNQIGDHAHIAPGAHLGGDVTIGEGVLIGIGAIVMPQRHIGRWSVLGAGALATHDLSDHVVAIGVPAQVSKSQPT